MTVIYGTANCDTVKKARAQLVANGLAYGFVDFKKQPPSVGLIESWLMQIPLDAPFNKRGTTWHKLTPQQQVEAADPQGAVKLMTEQPNIIGRPALDKNGGFHIGFSEESYRTLSSRQPFCGRPFRRPDGLRRPSERCMSGENTLECAFVIDHRPN